MSNQVKEVIRVLNEELETFEADNICLKRTNIRRMNGTTGHRSEFREWVDVPYVSTTVDGLTIADADFEELTALAVPHDVNVFASVPFKLTNNDTLDTSELSRKVRSAFQAIDNRINRAVANAVVVQGSQFVGRIAAISGFDDIAAIQTLWTEQDVSQLTDKTVILNPQDYNASASNLAARQTLNKGDITKTAYEEAMVARIARTMVFQTSFAPQKVARVLVSTTVNGAQSFTPQGHTLDGDGNPTNVDNRTMNLLVASTTGVVPGDKFTIAGVNAVSMQNKNDTGNLRTFSVISVTDGTNMIITPPIIDATDTAGTTAGQAKRDYGNVGDVAANSAVVTFINFDTGQTNLFWENDAISINTAPVTGSEDDLGGMILLNETTPEGLNVVIAKQGSINDFSTNWRLTTRFGVTIRDPLKVGIMMGEQTP